MNLLELSKQTGTSPEALRKKFEEKGFRLFSDTYPISEQLISQVMPALSPESPVPQKSDFPDNVILQTPSAQKKNSFLEECLKKKYHLIIDTCSILNGMNSFRKFYISCCPLLEKYHSELTIHYSVLAELAKNKLNAVNGETREIASQMITMIEPEVKNGNIRIIGDRNETYKTKGGKSRGFFGDNSIIKQLEYWYDERESFLLITNDNDLTDSVKNIPKVRQFSANRPEFAVRKLENGKLIASAKNKKKKKK